MYFTVFIVYFLQNIIGLIFISTSFNHLQYRLVLLFKKTIYPINIQNQKFEHLPFKFL